MMTAEALARSKRRTTCLNRGECRAIAEARSSRITRQSLFQSSDHPSFRDNVAQRHLLFLLLHSSCGKLRPVADPIARVHGLGFTRTKLSSIQGSDFRLPTCKPMGSVLNQQDEKQSSAPAVLLGQENSPSPKNILSNDLGQLKTDPKSDDSGRWKRVVGDDQL